MTNKNNPLAFPHSRLGSDCDGMSLRDYFASKAMQGLYSKQYLNETTYSDIEAIAEVAYLQADAMLKARRLTAEKAAEIAE